MLMRRTFDEKIKLFIDKIINFEERFVSAAFKMATVETQKNHRWDSLFSK